MNAVEVEFGKKTAPKRTHKCGCHGDFSGDFPTLQAMDLPHEIRHAAILGALASVQEGRGLILCADHNPRPLLKQVRDAFPDVFTVEYLEEGPDQWAVQFSR